MDTLVMTKVVANNNTPPATPSIEPVDSTIIGTPTTLALTDNTATAIELYTTPPPEPAAPAVQRPAFTYTNYTTNDGKPVTLHHCRDLASFTAAVELLKGQKYLGIDIEHQPFGKCKKGQKPLQQSDQAKQLADEANRICMQTFLNYSLNNLGQNVKLVQKKHTIPCGIAQRDDRSAYARFTRYAKTKLSVLQVASPRHIIVAHFAAFPHTDEFLDTAEFVPPALKTILANRTVLKMGVNVAGEQSDMRDCSRYFEMPSNGVLELLHLDAILRDHKKDGISKPGLKGLAEIWLGHTLIGKGHGNITTSEWQLPSLLSASQLNYAANDAFVSVKIYEAMMKEFDSMDPKPAFPQLLNERVFEYTAWLSDRIAELQAKDTKAAKRTLVSLGVKGEPPVPLNVPEGGSRTDAQSEKRRKAMAPEDAAMAEMLTKLRNEIMEEQGVAADKKHWVMEDRNIDRIAKHRPRPKTEEDFAGIISGVAWERMAVYADRFLEAMQHQEMLSELLEDSLQRPRTSTIVV
jgi:hypothetical protein